MRRYLPALAAVLLTPLAACQPAARPAPAAKPAGLSPEQVAVLRDQGFAETETGWEFGMADRLLFPTDHARLAPSQADRIAGIARALKAVDIVRLRVEGHTDATGTAAHNQRLSRQRADAVTRALIAGGLSAADIATIGLGKTRPLESNRTATGRAENRRVVIIVPSL
jgi:outer membrane protein OmpA-like peptidoglycan-associated protein